MITRPKQTAQHSPRLLYLLTRKVSIFTKDFTSSSKGALEDSDTEVSFTHPVGEADPDDPFISPLRQISEEPNLFETPREEFKHNTPKTKLSVMSEKTLADKLGKKAAVIIGEAKSIVTKAEAIGAKDLVGNMDRDLPAAEVAVASLSQQLENLKVNQQELKEVVVKMETADDASEANPSPFEEQLAILVP